MSRHIAQYSLWHACTVNMSYARYLYMFACVRISVFLIRSYGTPNNTGRCSVAQCYDNAWAMLAQSKFNSANIALVVALSDAGSHINIIVTSCMVQLKLYWLSYSLNWANLVHVKNLIKNPGIYIRRWNLCADACVHMRECTYACMQKLTHPLSTPFGSPVAT